MKFGAILHRAWEYGNYENEIIGYWYGDYAEYRMIVPCQLRDVIVEMQNWLCAKYNQWEKLSDKAREIERFFNS